MAVYVCKASRTEQQSTVRLNRVSRVNISAIATAGCGRYCAPPPEPKTSTLNFSSFKSSFTSNVNFLKRRFSSGDLSSEHDDVDPSQLPPAARPIQDQPTKPPISNAGPPNMPPPPAPGVPTAGAAAGGPELSLSFGGGKTATPAPPRGVSAPTSPAKSRESLLQRVQSLTGAARDQGASILGN
ncbi:synapsin-like, partial [Ceratitis capitata]|uniref:synapsin-like n=1 Tax=Ceratitis capitata TaxID=7213 RepID=UPI000C6C5074